MEPTNADLMKMLEDVGRRLASIELIVDKATGMWLLSKWVAGAALAIAAFISYVHEWWQK